MVDTLSECGTPEPADPDLVDEFQDVLEAYLHPLGRDGEANSR